MNCEDGGINSGKLWKLKKKLHTNFPDPPNVMKDRKGNILTEPKDILEETLNHYKKGIRKQDNIKRP